MNVSLKDLEYLLIVLVNVDASELLVLGKSHHGTLHHRRVVFAHKGIAVVLQIGQKGAGRAVLSTVALALRITTFSSVFANSRTKRAPR